MLSVPITKAVRSDLGVVGLIYRKLAMIRPYHSMSLILGLPGVVFQLAGLYLLVATGNSRAQVLVLIGIALLIAGLAYYAKAKAHTPWWCLLGLFSLLGLIVLALLPDDSFDEDTP